MITIFTLAELFSSTIHATLYTTCKTFTLSFDVDYEDFRLGYFNGISTLDDYLMPNFIHTYKLYKYDF